MIAKLANSMILLVAFLHLAFLVLEMFLWEKSLGRRVFRQTAERAAITRLLATRACTTAFSRPDWYGA